MASIDISGVVKRFGDFTAVRDLDLHIHDGELVALLGPSGCGKTTTMNIIAGFERPTAGRILFDGKDVSGTDPGQRGVGFVFQNYAIFTHMTVRENIAFGLEVRGTPRPEIDEAVERTAVLFGLRDHLDLPSRRLSVNEMQRLAIARSSIVKPAIFLLDEPLSNLDASFREEMRVELKALQRQLKQTMVYVTHDQVEAMSMADRIAILNNGELQQFASPAEVYKRPANMFVANFIGSPSMNLIHAVVRDGMLRVDLGNGRSASLGDVRDDPRFARLTSDKAVVGIRPELVQLEPLSRSDDAPGPGFDLRADHVERIGARCIVHLSQGDHRLVSIQRNGFAVSPGDGFSACLPLAHCMIFDGDTRAAVTGALS